MSLKLIVEKLDDVPEAQRELYEQTPDKKAFRLIVEGVPDVTKLEKGIEAERKARKELETSLKAFEGLDPEEARQLRDRFENDEEFKLFKTGDKEKLREKWTEKMRADYEKQLTKANAMVEDASKKAGKWSTRVLDNAIRGAALKLGLHSGGAEDALLRGRTLFSLDDDGNAVQLTKEGAVVMGKDGKTPYSPEEWLESMRETAPHWFPAPAQGGGAASNSGNGNNGQRRALKRSEFDVLSPKEKMAHSKSGGAVVDG